MCCSIVVFDKVYVSDVTPKTYYDDKTASYYISVTVCVNMIKEPSTAWLVSVDAKTDLQDLFVLGVRV